MYLSQIPIAHHRNYSKTNPNYVFVKFPSSFLPIPYSCHWSLNSSTNASFSISLCGFRGRTSVVKQEWILNCTTLTTFLERVLIGVILTKSHLVCCRGNLEFILNSKIRTKNAETVPLQAILKQSRFMS